MQLASYLKGGPLMWMMHLHVNQKSAYDVMIFKKYLNAHCCHANVSKEVMEIIYHFILLRGGNENQ